MRLPLYLLLALFSSMLALTLARAPGLSPGWTTPSGIARAEWARLAFDPSEDALARAWSAVRVRDGAAAAELARRSLSTSPSNAYAWLALAWAEALAGRDAAGRAALARSYELAPRSTPLAQSRSLLAQRWWPELSPEHRRLLMEEVRVARGLDPHAFNLAAANAPRLAVLHKLSERR